jgi:transketolase
VIAGDGCLMEGISHEAIDLAGHLEAVEADRAVGRQQISIDGATSLSTSMNQPMRFKAAGWDVQKVDGHDPEAVAAAIETARKSSKPSLIACRTTIGKGAPTMQGSHKTHGAPLGKEEIARAREALNWPYAPFTVPAGIKSAWEAVAERGLAARRQWQERHAAARNAAAFDRSLSGELPENVFRKLAAFRNKGRYIHYGIREHGMAAAMNGMALHGGVRPYGGTFMCFADYARPSMRLSALMGLPVQYVMTHDSIGLGEDGPTHQPVEHLAMLRATPNMLVFRPADAVETAEAWELSRRAMSPCLRPARKSRSPARQRSSCSTFTGSARLSFRCRAGRSSRRRIRATVTRCSAPPRALRLKPRPGWAGTAGSDRRAPSSAWTASVRPRRQRSSTSISASPPNGLPDWRSN